MTFVRDPLERLLSGYRDRAQHRFYFGIGKKCLTRVRMYDKLHYLKRLPPTLLKKKYRGILEVRDLLKSDAEPNSLVEMDTFAFRYHILVLTQRSEDDWIMCDIGLRHFATAYDSSRPCSIDYDFIGKFDSITEDSEYVIEQLGLSGKIHLGTHPSASKGRVFTYFRGMPKSIFLRACKAYEKDFQTFGYKVDPEIWEGLGQDHLLDEVRDYKSLDIYTDWMD